MIGDILQPTHLLFVLVIALLVLGPKRLPEVGRALGNGLRDFKSAINGEDDHHEEITDAPGFESHRSEALSDEAVDPPTETAVHEPPTETAVHEPPKETAVHEPPTATAVHEPAPTRHEAGTATAEHPPADARTAPAEHAQHEGSPVTSPAEPVPPAHPEDASAATAAQPSDGGASEPATERPERLG